MNNICKYVKLIARKDTWFKKGTEVYHYDSDKQNKYRISLEEWERDWLPYNHVLVRGTWVAEKGTGAVENCGYIEGQEYFDSAICYINEFDVEIVDKKY
jgi:hypothetical protein